MSHSLFGEKLSSPGTKKRISEHFLPRKGHRQTATRDSRIHFQYFVVLILTFGEGWNNMAFKSLLKHYGLRKFDLCCKFCTLSITPCWFLHLNLDFKKKYRLSFGWLKSLLKHYEQTNIDLCCRFIHFSYFDVLILTFDQKFKEKYRL